MLCESAMVSSAAHGRRHSTATCGGSVESIVGGKMIEDESHLSAVSGAFLFMDCMVLLITDGIGLLNCLYK